MNTKKKTIRLNESQLRSIVRESVRNFLVRENQQGQFDNADRQQKQKALQVLRNKGYENEWTDSYNNNDLVITVPTKAQDYNEAYKKGQYIKSLLMQALGIQDPSYLKVKIDSNMMGKDLRAYIQLPPTTWLN